MKTKIQITKFKTKKLSAIIPALLCALGFIVMCSEYDFDGKFDGNPVGGVTFYCPAACMAETGASRPSNCFESRDVCLASLDDDEGPVTPTCIEWVGNGCPTDLGYCAGACIQSARSACIRSNTFSQTRPSDCVGTFTDSRDNQTYHYVKIGNQVWMAENLNYPTSSGSWCYENQTSDCDMYGRLYDWATAMSLPDDCNINSCATDIQTPHRGVCPEGWHLPYNAEWTTLVNYAGGTPGSKLKSETGWNTGDGYRSATDDFGFSALPGGNRVDGNFSNVGLHGLWWTASELELTHAQYWYMSYNLTSVRSIWGDKAIGLSVRCVRDD